jgi:hypothetical protein
MPFVDVSPTDWHFEYVRYMYCRNVVVGYSNNPPCEAGSPCFKPNNSTTRGQVSKIVTLAFQFTLNTTDGPHFTDVPVTNTFYPYVETMVNMGIVEGYDDGTFRPNNLVTRGQISKMVVNAAVNADPQNWTMENPPVSTFVDVPVGSTFYQFIETAVSHGVIVGYPCGQPPSGPCQPGNKPYFLPYANATRAQISKIAYLAVHYRP